MKLSKEQRDKVINDLSYPWGRADLMCDGYRVTLSVERAKGMPYRVMTYVNGRFEGAWMFPKEECQEAKFMRKVVRLVCSPKHKREMEKIMGKRRVAKDPYYSKTLTHYMPDWASGKAALSHLCKVCDSVQVIDPQAAAVKPERNPKPHPTSANANWPRSTSPSRNSTSTMKPIAPCCGRWHA